MKIQGWLSVALFASAVIFSIVMASISPAFRQLWRFDQIWTGILYFLLIIVTAILVSTGAHCAVTSKTFDNPNTGCEVYSWALVVLTACLLALFITKGVFDHLDEKKDKQIETLRPTVNPIVFQE